MGSTISSTGRFAWKPIASSSSAASRTKNPRYLNVARKTRFAVTLTSMITRLLRGLGAAPINRPAT